jgi:hypothetical protein
MDCCRSSLGTGVALGLALGLVIGTGACAQSTDGPPDPAARELVRQMTLHEAAGARHKPDYFFMQEERSDRTGQHLWVEAVAETPHGPLRRLLAEDGKPLDAERQRAVDERVRQLASDPALMDQVNRGSLQDQQQGEALLTMSPDMYLYYDAGRIGDPNKGGVIKFAFKPNPAYVPQTYQERVIHAMEGTFLVDATAMRMKQLDAHLAEVVKFGYGLLGSVQSGTIHLVREETSVGDFKPQVFDLTVNGHILLFKTLGRQQHLVRHGFVRMGENAPLSEAAKMVLAAKL